LLKNFVPAPLIELALSSKRFWSWGDTASRIVGLRKSGLVKVLAMVACINTKVVAHHCRNDHFGGNFHITDSETRAEGVETFLKDTEGTFDPDTRA
jgi:hypothetical protein